MSGNARPRSAKPRLGRGLSSLIVNSSASAPPEGVYRPSEPDTAQPLSQDRQVETKPDGRPMEIPIGQIAPNPYQPRVDFREDDLMELTESIVRQGVLQPLVVTRSHVEDSDDENGKPFVLIAGERRLRACERAGFENVPCVLREATGQEMLEWALVENIHRRDLNPIERARAYREYMDRFDLVQAQVAERLGQPRATIANYLRLMDLPDSVQEMIVKGNLSFGHAKVLAGLVGQPAAQEKLAKKVVGGGLSVRQMEQAVQKIKGLPAGPGETAGNGKKVLAKTALILDLETQLSRTVGTRVTINPARKKNAGRITVEYYSLDDFDRITRCLGAELER